MVDSWCAAGGALRLSHLVGEAEEEDTREAGADAQHLFHTQHAQSQQCARRGGARRGYGALGVAQLDASQV